MSWLFSSEKPELPGGDWVVPKGEVNRIQFVPLERSQWNEFLRGCPEGGPAVDPDKSLKRLRKVLIEKTRDDPIARGCLDVLVPPREQIIGAMLFNVSGPPGKHVEQTPVVSFIVERVVEKSTPSFGAQPEVDTAMGVTVELEEWAYQHRRVMRSPDGPETQEAIIYDAADRFMQQ
jgi:hypothetical protein